MFENFGMVCSDCNSLMGIGKVNPETKVQLWAVCDFRFSAFFFSFSAFFFEKAEKLFSKKAEKAKKAEKVFQLFLPENL